MRNQTKPKNKSISKGRINKHKNNELRLNYYDSNETKRNQISYNMTDEKHLTSALNAVSLRVS